MSGSEPGGRGLPHGRAPAPSEDRSQRLRRSLAQLGIALVAVAVVALATGWLFGRGDAPRASRLLLSEDVVTEELAEQAPGPDVRVPTSGPQRGTPACGTSREPLAPEEQVVALAAGVVVVQHAPDLDPSVVAALRELPETDERVLVAPAPDLESSVVATAWRHRLDQETADVEQIETFVVGWAGRAPDPRPCP